jgi:hypothetical protein
VETQAAAPAPALVHIAAPLDEELEAPEVIRVEPSLSESTATGSKKAKRSGPSVNVPNLSVPKLKLPAMPAASMPSSREGTLRLALVGVIALLLIVVLVALVL